MKRLSVLLAVLMVLSFSSSVLAFSFITDYAGPIKIKYSNWEVVAEGLGDELTGIAKITTINALDSSNTLLWVDGYNGQELTATFEGYFLQQILLDSNSDPDQLFYTGGSYSVYLDDAQNFDATAPGSGVTDGISFLTLDAVTGIVLADDPSTPLFDESTTTLQSEISVNTTPLTGRGSGYLSVTGGDYAALFGGLGAEWFLESDFSPPCDPGDTGCIPRPGFGWPVVSEDPIVGTVVPEPGTFFLLGAGLVGLGFLARRKQS